MSNFRYTYNIDTGRVLSVDQINSATIDDSDEQRFFDFSDNHSNLYFLNGEFVVLELSQEETPQENIVHPGTIVGVPAGD